MMLALYPFSIDRRSNERPVATFTLVAVTLLVYGAVRVGAFGPSGWTFHWQEPTVATALVSQVLHEKFGHWFINAIGLLLFGTLVEDALGTRRFLAWLGVVLAASMVIEWAAFHGIEGSSYGSSGIVFACIGGSLLLAPGARVRAHGSEVGSRRSWSLPVWSVAALFALREVYKWVMSWMARDALPVPEGGFLTPPGATAMLHLIGFVAGVGTAYAGLKLGWFDVYGADLLQRRDLERDRMRAGGFVAPNDAEPAPGAYAAQPKCTHCGRIRPERLARCLYCGEA